MDNIQIKTKSLPKRCEICHQMDFFNPYSEKCSRCNGLVNLGIEDFIVNSNHKKDNYKFEKSKLFDPLPVNFLIILAFNGSLIIFTIIFPLFGFLVFILMIEILINLVLFFIYKNKRAIIGMMLGLICSTLLTAALNNFNCFTFFIPISKPPL